MRMFRRNVEFWLFRRREIEWIELLSNSIEGNISPHFLFLVDAILRILLFLFLRLLRPSDTLFP